MRKAERPDSGLALKKDEAERPEEKSKGVDTGLPSEKLEAEG
jgi:hypothetical protein